MLYLFWWQSFIHASVNVIKTIGHKNAPNRSSLMPYIGGNFFLLFIYLIFIIVLFGTILNFNNTDLVILNFQTIYFKNWSFNLNLIFILLFTVFFKKLEPDKITSSMAGLTIKNIILHISIILGGLMQFFIVLRYDTIFTEDNLWGSVLVIAPFLILRALFDRIEY
ncbi:MAG TPA: hypothetical protein VKX29_05435 [Brumimicrobium sp.]|nr:hypothetical protein [Brumimicrobium sp.]